MHTRVGQRRCAELARLNWQENVIELDQDLHGNPHLQVLVSILPAGMVWPEPVVGTVILTRVA